MYLKGYGSVLESEASISETQIYEKSRAIKQRLMFGKELLERVLQI